MKATNGKHTYELWYLQNSLEADYGYFKCDKCGRDFYHSPAIIYYNHQVKYPCCCGHCTNAIIYQEWKKKPYQ